LRRCNEEEEKDIVTLTGELPAPAPVPLAEHYARVLKLGFSYIRLVFGDGHCQYYGFGGSFPAKYPGVRMSSRGARFRLSDDAVLTLRRGAQTVLKENSQWKLDGQTVRAWERFVTSDCVRMAGTIAYGNDFTLHALGRWLGVNVIVITEGVARVRAYGIDVPEAGGRFFDFDQALDWVKRMERRKRCKKGKLGDTSSSGAPELVVLVHNGKQGLAAHYDFAMRAVPANHGDGGGVVLKH
jgi:hypothetical protein